MGEFFFFLHLQLPGIFVHSQKISREERRAKSEVQTGEKVDGDAKTQEAVANRNTTSRRFGTTCHTSRRAHCARICPCLHALTAVEI